MERSIEDMENNFAAENLLAVVQIHSKKVTGIAQALSGLLEKLQSAHDELLLCMKMLFNNDIESYHYVPSKKVLRTLYEVSCRMVQHGEVIQTATDEAREHQMELAFCHGACLNIQHAAAQFLTSYLEIIHRYQQEHHEALSIYSSIAPSDKPRLNSQLVPPSVPPLNCSTKRACVESLVGQINGYFMNVDVLQGSWLEYSEDSMTNLGLLHMEALSVALRRVFWRCFVHAQRLVLVVCWPWLVCAWLPGKRWLGHRRPCKLCVPLSSRVMVA
jgi:hypothetical protein